MFKKTLSAVVSILLAFGVTAVALPSAAVATQPDFICEDLDSGKIDTVGDPATVTVYAPPGYLIDGYCVKAGTTKYFIVVDPPAASVIVDHPDKDSVSHYSLSYVIDVCSNIEGAQSTVPEGYTQNQDGTCTEVTPTPTSGQPTTQTKTCSVDSKNWITLPAVSGGAWVITHGVDSSQVTSFDAAPPFGTGVYTLNLIDLDDADLFDVQEASFPYTAVDKEDLPCVTAGDPVFVPAVCNVSGPGITAGSYTVVDVTGVRYEKVENGGAPSDIDPGTYYVNTFPTTIKITGFAIDPNVLVNDPATWSFEFVSPGACIDNDASASLNTLPATCELPERIVYLTAVNSTWNPLVPPTGAGTLIVTANADAGHAFAGGQSSLELFNGTLDPVLNDPEECDLPTEGQATPSYSSTPLTCFAAGTFTVGAAINGEFVNWSRAGTPGVLPFGTYSITSPQAVVLTAVSTDPIHHGLVDINSDEWVNPVVLTFTQPRNCELTTLALTGSGGLALGGLSLGGGLLFLGLAALYMRRKAALLS